jgi:hypothetical protein
VNDQNGHPLRTLDRVRVVTGDWTGQIFAIIEDQASVVPDSDPNHQRLGPVVAEMASSVNSGHLEIVVRDRQPDTLE